MPVAGSTPRSAREHPRSSTSEAGGLHAAYRPAWFHALAIAYFLVGLWLCLRAHVFMDQVWITEWGRRFLHPDTGHSMFMLPDGTTLPPPAWLGALLAELAFLASGDLVAFRWLAVTAALAMSYAFLRLAIRHGVPSTLAALLSLTLLFDPTMLQSVICGRADTLAIATLLCGLLIADKASDVSTPERVLWVRLAIGYSLAALSAAIWSTALLLGPLAALHWAHRWRSLRAGCASATRMRWTVLLIAPGMVFLTAVVWPHWHAHAIGAEHAAVWTRHFGDGALDSLFIGLQMLAISLPLVVIGVLALIQLRPAWLAIWMAGGALVVLLSGFYPFRIPYLLVWMAATIALLARNSPPHMAEGLRKLAGIVAMLVLALAGLRVLLAFDNPLPPTGDPWLARLPAGTRVADFGWEFYAPARRRDLAIMRSFPGLEASGVVAWLRAARPDFVLRPAIPQNAWVMVEDADAVFAEGGYCRSGFIDWSGTRVDERSRVRTPPTPALWRLGASRDYGPYVLWAPCGAPGPHSMTMWM